MSNFFQPTSDNSQQEITNKESELFKFPDGLAKVSETLDFIQPEDRFNFMIGWIIAALMED